MEGIKSHSEIFQNLDVSDFPIFPFVSFRFNAEAFIWMPSHPKHRKVGNIEISEIFQNLDVSDFPMFRILYKCLDIRNIGKSETSRPKYKCLDIRKIGHWGFGKFHFFLYSIHSTSETSESRKHRLTEIFTFPSTPLISSVLEVLTKTSYQHSARCTYSKSFLLLATVAAVGRRRRWATVLLRRT